MDRLVKGLIIDANILVNAALGERVRNIMTQFHDTTAFSVPDVCRDDARRRIPQICRKHGLDQNRALEVLGFLERMIRVVEPSTYLEHKEDARLRIAHRDPDDWPIVATALALDLPIWTEDRDFFGCGIATWITNTVEIYLGD